MKIPANILTLLLLILLVPSKSQGQLIITEVQSSNSALTFDFDEYDWVEIYNAGSTDIDLTGYYMSDNPDNLLKSQLSVYVGPLPSDMDPVLKAGEFTLVFCSNTDVADINRHFDYFHTNFKLSSEGEEIHLSAPDGSLISSLVFPALSQNESYGFNTNGDLGYFSVATPEAENGNDNFSLTTATLTAPVVDLPSQIFTTSQQVTFVSAEPGTIYYTLDGSNPTVNSTQYTGAFSVSATTVVKSILIQSDTGETSRFGMRTLLFDKSHDLGIVSLTTENFTRFGSSGDYRKPVFNGRVWVELIEPDNSTSIAQYADYTASGRTSGHVPPMNGKLRTKEKYGDEVFSNRGGAIFPNKQHIEDVFGFAIRNGSQDWNAANMRDVFGTALITEGSLVDYGFEDNRRVVVYVNGEYQGVLSITEDDDDDFVENNYQGQNITTQYDLDSLTTFIEHSVDFTNETERNSLLEKINIRDYHFFNFHLAYGDMTNETGALHYVTEGEKADWVIHDEDTSFNINPLFAVRDFTIGTPLEYPFTELKADDYEPFKEDLIQSFCAYANFMYDDARVLEILNAQEAAIESEMEATIQHHKDYIAERAGLGITFFRDGVPVDDLAAWKSEVQVIRDFVTGRLDNLFSDLQARYGLEAPENFEISSSDYDMGCVRVQGVKLREETMTGQFFKDLPIELIAEPNAGFQFSHWEGVSTSTDTQITATINTSSQITAVFEAILPPVLLGDCDVNGVVNFSDISPFITILLSSNFVEQADCNQNGVVDFSDISPFITILLSGQ